MFIFIFGGGARRECAAYNFVVSQVMRRENLNPFHQLGADGGDPDKPGLHWWEALHVASVSREKLLSLIHEMKPRIERMIREDKVRDF